MARDGILSDPLDLDGRRPGAPRYATVAARPGRVVEHRATGVVGSIRSWNQQIVVLRDRHDVDRPVRNHPGGFLVDGRPVTLVPVAAPRPPPPTASGSTAPGARSAREARASRILVEGVHDAELVEKVWGDDLRELGVVVERLDGMDDLADVVRDFDPAPRRRLGVLLDHLVDGSKESLGAADSVRHPHVLVTGTPFVDVWAAVRPGVVGIVSWPDVPRGVPWKAGVLDALDIAAGPGEFWRQVLGSVRTYADLDPTLVGAVERLIDFVTEGDDGVTVRREQVTVGDGSFAAHVVVPDQPNGAGILLVQEIFGVGPYITAVADRLAGLGYAVAAPDLFWRFAPGHVADHDEAGLARSVELVGQLDGAKAVVDCIATLAHLRELPEVSGPVGVLGFCLGGSLAVGCALAGDPDAVVSYYGSAVPSMVEQLGQITAPTLLHFGGADPFIPDEQLQAVIAVVPQHPAIELNVEAGAGHTFDNHEAPMFYDADAAAHAWELTRAFLARHLRS